jgi:predicted phosphodiesterase
MRVFATSDLHIDYSINARWVSSLSATDYTEDILVLAGDVADTLPLLAWGLKSLAGKFRQVLFVPGNHDIWVMREPNQQKSLDKFRTVCGVAEDCGVSMRPFHCGTLSIVPLLAWYDYSFGSPQEELHRMWLDYDACAWPESFEVGDITAFFLELNRPVLGTHNRSVISFSHFLPRIDVMPSFIPESKRILYPVLGTSRLEQHVRQLQPWMHVYGHSHVNQQVVLDGIAYLNNAFGYPSETWTSKSLVQLTELDMDSGS